MILKSLYWDLRDAGTRNEYLYEFARNAPGRLGFYLRGRFFAKRMGTAGSHLRVHKGCRIINIKKMHVGDHVHFGVDSYLQAGGGITVGDYTEMGPGVKIWSQTHIFDDPDKPLEGAGYEYNEVIIGSNVWIGANAFIMPGVELGDGCVVAAGSVVGVKAWGQGAIISGNPARKIGKRGQMRGQEK
jgi:acetyltransferase-like isoleucine patch superfamily enzyme